MRAAVVALVLLTLAAPTAGATTQPEAQLLLDLDLLRERDPRLQRDEAVAGHVRLLELLERLTPRPAARGGDDARPAPKEAC